jgi:hypothetical protein
VAGEIFGGLRNKTLREIARCSDNRHAPVRRDAGGDHILGHLFAQPDAGVIAALDDV